MLLIRPIQPIRTGCKKNDAPEQKGPEHRSLSISYPRSELAMEPEAAGALP
jgi:hypothetical protein